MKKLAMMSAAALLAGGAALGALTAPSTILPATAEAIPTTTATPTPTATASATATAAPVVTPTATPVPTVTADPQGHPDCANLKPGDAWAGVGLHCGLNTQAPVPTITVEPAPAPTADVPVRMEDDPAWDCLVDGNKVCGPTALQRVEAWGAFRTDDMPDEVLREAFRVTYMGTALPGIDFPPSQYVTIPSQLTANRVHVFMVEPGPF